MKPDCIRPPVQKFHIKFSGIDKYIEHNNVREIAQWGYRKSPPIPIAPKPYHPDNNSDNRRYDYYILPSGHIYSYGGAEELLVLLDVLDEVVELEVVELLLEDEQHPVNKTLVWA